MRRLNLRSRALALALAAGSSLCLPPPFRETAQAQTAPADVPAQTCLSIPSATLVGDASGPLPSPLWRQYQMTPEASGKTGAVWGGTKADLTRHFSTASWIYLGARTDSGGGDGMAFALHNDPRPLAQTLGPGGLGLGAADSHTGASPPTTQPGIQRSLIVEFDAYQNIGAGSAGILADPLLTWRDPASDHVALFLNADGRHTNAAWPSPYLVPGGLKTGRYHFLRVSWDPAAKRFQVYLNHRLAQSLVLQDPTTYFGASQLAWGYAAATGGAYNSHRVCMTEAPGQPTADYGDAPAGYGHAWHMRPTHLDAVHMGYAETARPSTEAATRSHALAQLDEREDAFLPNNPFWSGGYVPLRGWGGGYLNAWIDWNRDGVFSAEEQTIKDAQDEGPEDAQRGAGGFMQIYAPPRPDLMTAGAGQSFIRMRWSTQPGLGPTGEAPDGEVEDHAFQLVAPKAHDCGLVSAEAGKANFASAGPGLYKKEIFWLDWACAGSEQFNAGDTVVKRWTLPSGHVLTGRLHDVRGSMRPYQMGQQTNESLNRSYQGLRWVGLSTRYQNPSGISPYVGFKLSLELSEPGGATLPYSLTTLATEAEAVHADENLTLTTNGAPWALIEAEGQGYASFSADGRTVFAHNQSGGFGGQIFASAAGSEIDAVLGPNGSSFSVAAFGVFAPTDFGDAPASYGPAAHLQTAGFEGGARPTVSTPSSAIERAIRLASALFMGAGVTAEAGLLGTIGADGDLDDGASFSRQDSLGRPLFGAGRTTRVTVQVHSLLPGWGRLRGWIDWNGNGTFDSSEIVALDLADGGAGDLDPRAGFIAFDVRAPLGAATSTRYLRLRWSATPGIDPLLPVLDGETEDHLIFVQSVDAPALACPAGHALREAIRNPTLQTPGTTAYSWSEWTASSGIQAAEYGSPWSGFYMHDDAQAGSVVQTVVPNLGLGPSVLGGGVLFMETQWQQGNPAALSSATPSRLAVLIDGVTHLVVESGPGATAYGEVAYPVSEPGAVDRLDVLTWAKLRVDLPPIHAPAGSTVSLVFTPPGGAGTPNDDFRIRSFSIQNCTPQGEIALEIKASSMTPLIEAPMEFEIYAHSKGPQSVKGLVVRALPPSGYRFISAAPGQGSYVASTGLWTVGDLPAGQSRLLRLTVTPLTSGVRTMIAEATAYTHIDLYSAPNNGVTTERDYAAVTPAPQSGAPPAFTPPPCRTGEPARQIALNGNFQGWVSPNWPNWSKDSVNWTTSGGQGAHFSLDNASGALWQGGLTNLNRGPGFSDAALIHLEVWWRNGAPPVGSTSSAAAVLTISLGGETYAVVTTQPDMTPFAQAAAHGGAAIVVGGRNGVSTTSGAMPEFAATSLQIHAPASVVASGELRFHFRSSGAYGDDFRIRSAAVYVCDGDVALSPSHESTVPPGQIAIYPHNLTLTPAMQGAAVSFQTISEQGLGWTLHKDDGDGIFNAALDPVWVPGAALAAGSHAFWLSAHIPANAPAGWRDLTSLRVRAVLGGLTAEAEVQDLTRVGGAAEGWIHAVKTAAPDSSCAGTPDAGAPFVAELTVSAGGCVVYRVLFENRSVEPVRRVRVHDHTPDWTTYLGDSARIVAMPGSLSAPAMAHPAAGAEGPILFAFDGALLPGESGAVQFGVRLLGGSGGGSGGPPN